MASRDPFRVSEVASRRDRPAKPPLSRDSIVEEGLRQVTEPDGTAMSLRRIATALDTGPASLYAYVDDLTHLQALVLDRALDAVDIGNPGEPWRGRLEVILRSYGQTLSASPALARLAFGTVAVGPSALRITEALLEVLADAGVGARDAAWAVDLLTMYVTAAAAEHANGPHPAESGGPVDQALDRVSPADHPRVHAARDHLTSGTGDQRLTWATDILIRGLLSRTHQPPGEDV